MILAVNYDLHNPGRDYPKIEAALKTADGGCAHPQGSFWIIDTREDCATWRDRLAKLGDTNDEFFIGQFQKHWASHKMDTPVVDWLNDARRRW
jgi:hypothetical protein